MARLQMIWLTVQVAKGIESLHETVRNNSNKRGAADGSGKAEKSLKSHLKNNKKQ